MTEEALKPCPFCGKGAMLCQLPSGFFQVRCRSCCGQTGVHNEEDQAVQFWNARAVKTCPKGAGNRGSKAGAVAYYAKDLIEAAPPTSSAPSPQWRPMAEAPERGYFLVSFRGEIQIAQRGSDGFWINGAYFVPIEKSPEAWMPLPDPLPYPSRTVSD